MKNHELFKFADIIEDIIIDYYNGETEFKNEKDVLMFIKKMCWDTLITQSN